MFGVVFALACLFGSMALFEETEVATSPDWGDEEDMRAADWTDDFPERPPMIRRLPTLWALPASRRARGNGLYELVTEYIHRKFTVLAELMERAYATDQGVMSTTVWAKTRAIETTSATLCLPNVG